MLLNFNLISRFLPPCLYVRIREGPERVREKKRKKAEGESEQRSECECAKERNKMQIKEKQQISLVLSTIK